jgi:hypothetical protein
MIAHDPTCTPYYPEKPVGELPQEVVEIPWSKDKTKVIRVCVDCGAYELAVCDV